VRAGGVEGDADQLNPLTGRSPAELASCAHLGSCPDKRPQQLRRVRHDMHDGAETMPPWACPPRAAAAGGANFPV